MTHMIARDSLPDGDSTSRERAPTQGVARPSTLRLLAGQYEQYHVLRGGRKEQESFSPLQEPIKVSVPIEGEMVQGEILGINIFNECLVYFAGYSDPTKSRQLLSFSYLQGINPDIRLEGRRIARRAFMGAGIAIAGGALGGVGMVSGKIIWDIAQQGPFDQEPPGYNEKRIEELERTPERIRNGAAMGAGIGATLAAAVGGIVKIMHARDARQARNDVEAIRQNQS